MLLEYTYLRIQKEWRVSNSIILIWRDSIETDHSLKPLWKTKWDILISRKHETQPTMAMEPNGNNSLVRQRLLYAEEVYLYKIPPMKDANGHR